MPVRSRLLATACVAAACLAAQEVPANAVGGDPVVSRGVTIPAFYTPPSTLPSANGALIRTQPMSLALSLPGLDGKPLPGTATRLMYKSTDSHGNPVAVTGAYVEPAAPWPAGPRPLVVVAPGTLGQGDQCSASLGLENPLTTTDETTAFGYEDLAIYRLLANGIGVVVTDYVGLGATDRAHTYVNRLDEAHAVLDAARAARSLPGTYLTSSSRIGLFGYSQGGGASAAAAELQPSYAPDVTLAGTYAGAPPANLTNVLQGIDGSQLEGAVGWALNGFAQSDPSLQPVIDAHTNAAGKAAFADLSTMCVADALPAYGSTNSTAWTVDGRSLSAVIAAEPRIQATIDAQHIGTLNPTSPVRIATNVSDDIVSHGQARQLAVDWCGRGANVTYTAIVMPSLGDKSLLNHIAPLITDQGDAINWMADRLVGLPVLSNCWTMPVQP